VFNFWGERKRETVTLFSVPWFVSVKPCYKTTFLLSDFFPVRTYVDRTCLEVVPAWVHNRRLSPNGRLCISAQKLSPWRLRSQGNSYKCSLCQCACMCVFCTRVRDVPLLLNWFLMSHRLVSSCTPVMNLNGYYYLKLALPLFGGEANDFTARLPTVFTTKLRTQNFCENPLRVLPFWPCENRRPEI